MLYGKFFLFLLLFASILVEYMGQLEDYTHFSHFKDAYGGALYVVVEEKSTNDTEISMAAEFAVGESMRNFPHATQVDNEGGFPRYEISSPTLSRVAFSKDGKRPFFLTLLDTHGRHPRQEPIIWGTYFTFTLSIPSQQTTPAVHHNFTIFQYWDGIYHLFQHTFQGIKAEEKPQQQPGSPGVHKSVEVSQTDFERTSDSGHGCPPSVLSDIEDNSNQYSISLCDFSMSGSCLCSCQLTDRQLPAVTKYSFFNIIKQCGPSRGEFPEQNCINTKSAIPHNRFQERKRHDGDSSRHYLRGKHQPSQNNSAPQSTGIPLKILTFNIWNVNSHPDGPIEAEYKARIQHLAALCRSSDADIIAFQEVRFQDAFPSSDSESEPSTSTTSTKGLGPSQIRHLADLLPGYQFVFQPAQAQLSVLPALAAEGLAFFSRHPISARSHHFLRRDPHDQADSHQRVLLHVEVVLPGVGQVHLFNTHLSLSHKARATSVIEIWKYMEKFKGPAFLMGDFNAEAHNVEVQFLNGKAELKSMRTHGLHDAWLLRHGTSNPGYTYGTLKKQLTKRIDLIFMRELPQVSLVDVQLLDDGTRKEKAASDHLGLVAEFHLTKTPV